MFILGSRPASLNWARGLYFSRCLGLASDYFVAFQYTGFLHFDLKPDLRAGTETLFG